MSQSEKIFKALANDRRLEILKTLSKFKELNVLEMAAKIKLSFKSTSKHLRILENAGLLAHHREGSNSYYFLIKNNPLFNRELSGFISEG